MTDVGLSVMYFCYYNVLFLLLPLRPCQFAADSYSLTAQWGRASAEVIVPRAGTVIDSVNVIPVTSKDSSTGGSDNKRLVSRSCLSFVRPVNTNIKHPFN
jgi:hypothetical protein